MKQRFIIMTLGLLLTVLSKAQSIDSLSYAYGHTYAKENLATLEFEWEKTPANYQLFFKGIEENWQTHHPEASDSIYAMSYSLGLAQVTYFGKAFEQAKDGSNLSITGIIKGLRKVAEDSLQLPKDSIAICKYFAQKHNYKNLSQEEKETYSINYGVMEGLNPGLQQLFSKIMLNKKAYAAAMADILEHQNSQRSPYGDGKFLIRTNYSICEKPIKKEDFILGAKAALSLSQDLLSEKQCNDIMEKLYEVTMKKYKDFLDKLQ